MKTYEGRHQEVSVPDREEGRQGIEAHADAGAGAGYGPGEGGEAKKEITIGRKAFLPIPAIGEAFSHWTVVGPAEKFNGHIHIVCRCTCGKEKAVYTPNLIRGKTHSCGCVRKPKDFTSTHHPEWRIWNGIKSRCYNPNRRSFKDYGGRGISLCREWKDDFKKFLEDMGPRPSPQHSIERIDNDKDYAPDNRKWATMLEQAQNRRRTVRCNYNGRELTVSQLARETGVNYHLLYARIVKGNWPMEAALTIPSLGDAEERATKNLKRPYYKHHQ